MRYHEFRRTPLSEALVNEVKMSPSRFQKFLDSDLGKSARAGFEAELIFPEENFLDSEEINEYVEGPDDDLGSLDDAVDFFYNNGDSGRSRSYIERAIQEWYEEKVRDLIDEEFTNHIKNSHTFDREFLEIAIDFINDEYLEDDIPDEFKEDDEIEASLGLISFLVSEYSDKIKDFYYSNERWFTDTKEELTELAEQHILDGYSYSMSDIRDDTDLDWPMVVNDDFIGQSTSRNYRPLISRFMNETDGFGYDARQEADGQYDIWNFTSDSSLPEDTGVEIISPVMPLSKLIEIIPKFFDWVADNGGAAIGDNEVNVEESGTGFHMNISFPNYSIDNLNYVKYALFLGDKYLLEQFGRYGNRYTVSAIDDLTRFVNPDNVASVTSAMQGLYTGFDNLYSALDSSAKKLVDKGAFRKMVSINPKANWVEIRSAGNEDYFSDPVKLQQSLSRAAYALSIALDPEAEKREFAKKLYQLLSGYSFTNSQNIDLLKIFALYASGNMVDKNTMRTYIAHTIARDSAKDSENDRLYLKQQRVHVVLNNPYINQLVAQSGENDLKSFTLHLKDSKNPFQWVKSEARKRTAQVMQAYGLQNSVTVIDKRTGEKVPFDPMNKQHLPDRDIQETRIS